MLFLTINTDFRAKFGQEVSGGRATSIFTISRSEVDKVKVFKKFLKHKEAKKKLKTKVKPKKLKKIPLKDNLVSSTPDEPKIELDHRNYGAWYIDPTKWEKRFQNLSDPKSIDIIKARILAKKEKQDKFFHQKQEKVNTHQGTYKE